MINRNNTVYNFDSMESTVENVIKTGESAIGKSMNSNEHEYIADTIEYIDKENDYKTRSIYSHVSSSFVGLTDEEATKIATKAATSYRSSSGATQEISAAPENKSGAESQNQILNAIDSVLNALKGVSDDVDELFNEFGKRASGASADLFQSGSTFGTFLGLAGRILSSAVLEGYTDGVESTTFGTIMERSWYGDNSRSFLSNLSTGQYKIKFLDSTPLDGTEDGDSLSSVYGNMILGVPFLFNKLDDVENRTLLNTFAKDMRIVSLTPGLPKYNGGLYTQGTNNSYSQTQTKDEIIKYLRKNGLDSSFSAKDKRYYVFEEAYEQYYSYLESMLTPLWIKLGLAGTEGEFNLFSFFKIDNESTTDYTTLKNQYRSSIGFFFNGTLSEQIDSSETSFGIGNDVNSASENYQRINFLTGMGTGGSILSNSRRIANAYQLGSDIKSTMQEKLFKGARVETKSSNPFVKIAALGATIANIIPTVMKNMTEYDPSALAQQFAVTNGMKVMYPELWSDSRYSKTVNFDLTFTSPYGDPLSIFQYVYVPFCALLAFCLPRQAADNGYVSPFFVRADVPGLFTSDLAMISNVSWIKGGNSGLFTKDGLPRSITCSVSLTDLYPYLAMTKRYSFLSANPSFSVFLDNMAGLGSLYKESISDDPLQDYWKQMINRVSGSSDSRVISEDSLWNRFNTAESTRNLNFYSNSNKRRSVSSGNSIKNVPWMRKVK